MYVLLQKKSFYRKILQTNTARELVHGHFCVQTIMQNLYWKMKFLKQVEGIAYVMAKLLKYVKIKQANFLNFLFTKDSLQIKKV